MKTPINQIKNIFQWYSYPNSWVIIIIIILMISYDNPYRHDHQLYDRRVPSEHILPPRGQLTLVTPLQLAAPFDHCWWVIIVTIIIMFIIIIIIIIIVVIIIITN